MRQRLIALLIPLPGILIVSFLLTACSSTKIEQVQQAAWPYGNGFFGQQKDLANLEAVQAAAGTSGKAEWVIAEDSRDNSVVEAHVDRAGAGIEKPQTIWLQWTINKNTGRVSMTGFTVDQQAQSPLEASLLTGILTAS